MDETQQDFLKIVLNSGLDRASAALGELTGSHFNVAVPMVSVCEPDQLNSHVGIGEEGDVFTVSRSFSGLLSGDVLLVLTGFSGRVLTNRLCVQLTNGGEVKADAEEIVTKIGNVITNHFISTWAALLADRFDYSVPTFQLCSLGSVVSRYGSAECPEKENRRAVCAQTQMDVPDFTVAASLIVMFKKDSLERLIGSVSGEPKG